MTEKTTIQRIQKAEKELLEREKQYRQLFEHSLNGIALHEIVTDKDGVPVDYIFLEVNPRFEEFTGLKADKVLGKLVTEAIPGVREARFIEIYGKVALTGKPVQFEEFSVPLQRHYAISAFSPRPGQFVTSFTDITERKKTEDEIARSRQELDQIFNVVTPICLIDKNFITLKVNDNFCSYFGVTREEVIGKPCYDLRQGPRCGKEKCMLRQVLGGVEEASYELEKHLEDGRGISCIINARPFRGPFGEVQGIVESFTDITERKKAEKRRTESEERFRTLFQAAPDATFLVDIESNLLVDVNPAAEKLTRRSRKELIGSHRKTLHPTHIPQLGPEEEVFYQKMEEARKTGMTEPHESMVLQANGSTVPVEIVSKLIQLKGRALLQGVFRNISERKKAEEERKESEERFRVMSSSAQDAIIMMDSKGKISFWSEGATRIFCFTEEEAMGKVVHQLLTPEQYHGAFHKAFPGFVNSGQGAAMGKTLELTGKRKGGIEFPVELSLSGVEIRGEWNAIAIVRDITDRKKADEELRESEERYRDLFESTNDLIQLVSEDGILLYVNPAWKATMGYSEEEIDGLNVFEVICDEKKDSCRETFQELAREGEQARDIETSYLTKEGCKVILEGNVSAKRDGEKMVFRCIFRDITERRGAEEDRRLLEIGIQQAGEAVVITDTEGNIQYVNPAFQEITGYSTEEAMGQNPRVLKSGKHDALFYKRLWATLLEGNSWRGEFINKRKDGALYYERATINPVKDDSGETISYIAVKEDVTEQKKVEEELRKTNLELVVANKQKSEFVSIVSHDFGNPLGIIMGNVEMMLLGVFGELTDKMREKLGIVSKTALRLNKLRTDTLDLSKMDRGKLELAREKQDFAELVRDVVEESRDSSREKGQTITLDSPKDLMAKFDREQVHRVLENYLSNAIRYTPVNGQIGLNVREEDGELVVCVKDSGRGIDPAELENIFKPFYRTGKRVPGSTGLGLSIVEGIINAHRGRCWAESKGDGKGSSFFFTLPLD